MIRVVLDANVVVSGVLGIERAESAPGAIIRAWERREFDLLVSDALIDEIERTLTNRYFAARIDSGIVESVLSALRDDAIFVPRTVVVEGVASHPEDDRVLATVASTTADYLVTGDRQLLALGHFEGTPILTPAEFVEVLERQR